MTAVTRKLAGTYSVQKLVTVPSNETTAVTVQCFFAVNAPAQGCLVVFSNLSFTFNETIIRFNNATKAEKDVAIPNTLLSNVSYVLFYVAAYDYYINQAVDVSNPAVVLYDQVTLIINPSMSTSPSQSIEAVSSTPTCMLHIFHCVILSMCKMTLFFVCMVIAYVGGNCPLISSIITSSVTMVPTTELPTTKLPTTEFPTTGLPTTELPTTEMPTTEPPTTELPANGADLYLTVGILVVVCVMVIISTVTTLVIACFMRKKTKRKNQGLL